MLRKTLVIALLIIFVCLDGFASNKKLSEVDKDASEILLKVSNILAMDNVRSEQVMTVARKDGSIRQYRLKIMTSGNDKVFAEIVEPKKFKGRQFLRLGDVVWAYFPSVSSIDSRAGRRMKTAIRVSGRDTFMGGDFSNNDILRLNLIDDYIPEIIDDLPDQYVLKLKGKNLGLTYSSMRLWVLKKDFQPIRLETYSINDDLIKSIFYQDYRQFEGGLIRPGMLEVKSAILPKSKTFLEIIYLKSDITNPDRRFLKTNLGK